mgnify:CR=1 FL=1
MNSREYIESGILELYVFGKLSDEEIAEVNQMAAQYPEVREEIKAIESAVINLSHSVAPHLSATNFEKIRTELLGRNKVVTMKPRSNWSQYTGWVAAAVLVVGFGLQFYKLNQTNETLNNVSNQKDLLQESVVDLELKKKESEEVLAILRDTSNIAVALAGQLFSKRKYTSALRLLLVAFDKIGKTDSNRAVIAYLISENYRLLNDKGQEKKWLALSAISDLELVKKENISLRKLAYILYEEGEIESAYEYTKRSLDDAVFCNSKLRTYEISKMLPIINESYETKNKSSQSQLIVFLISVSVLSLFLIGVLILLFKQMKKVAKAQKNVKLVNQKLSVLNQQLQGFNAQLNQTNLELAETSLLKEIYIGRYMDQCSVYIGKMEEYSQKLKVMATAGKVNDLVSTVKSKAFIDKELKEFYSQFDQTFVQLFPTFVAEFKDLLNEPESIVIKKGELLNPELRLFALIRLGIKDSAKIAEFLRYSSSTIYNYRSQIKNKAKGPRDQFELKVMDIGTSSK